jgi:hypothetical protein
MHTVAVDSTRDKKLTACVTLEFKHELVTLVCGSVPNHPSN